MTSSDRDAARAWRKETGYTGNVVDVDEAFLAGCKFKQEQLTEDFFVKVIEKWKFKWMDVTGTDEADRKNYFGRAYGVDANMQYSLASMLVEALKGDTNG